MSTLDYRRSVAREIARRVQRALLRAPLDGVAITETLSEPRMLTVTRGGVVVMSCTIRGSEAALPTPRQPPLPGTEDAVVRLPAPAPVVPGSGELFEAIAFDRVEDLRARHPEPFWRQTGELQSAALVAPEVAERLRADGIAVQPFDPSCDPPVVVEVWDTTEVGAELARQLAEELGGAVGRVQQEFGESYVELPPIADAERLRWAVAYLAEARVRFWVKPSQRRGRGARGGR